MTMNPHSQDDVCERAALYALGALPADEARDFQSHVDTCAACSAELRAFTEAAADLGGAAAPRRPRVAVRARLLERIAAEEVLAQQSEFEQDGVRFVRSTHLPWQHGNAPKIELKTLFVDNARGYVTKLVRMPPGSALRPHRHVEVEESYVLEGELLVSGVCMRAGDYCRAEPGSIHTSVVSRTGCVFIAVSSQRDELLG